MFIENSFKRKTLTIIGTAATLLLAGCGSTIKTGSSPEASGMRYFLPKTIIELQTQRSVTTKTELKFIEDRVLQTDDVDIAILYFDEAIDSRPKAQFDRIYTRHQFLTSQCFEVHSSKTQKAELSSLNNTTVADLGSTYAIAIDPSIWIDGKISINRTDKALLSSISIDTSGKADETLIAAAKAAALVAGVMSGNPTAAVALVSATTSYKDLAGNVKNAGGQEKADGLSIPKLESCKLFAKRALGISEATFDELTPLQLITLLNDKRALEAVKLLPSYQERLSKHDEQIERLEQELADAEGDKFIEISKKLKTYKTQRQAAKDMLAAFTADYSNRTEAQKTKYKLGSKTKTTNHQAIFDISQIPSFDDFVAMANDSNNAGNYANSLALFKESGFALTLNTLSSFPKCGTNNSTCEVTIDDSEDPFIAYRDPASYLLNVSAIKLPELASTCKPINNSLPTVACSVSQPQIQIDPTKIEFEVKERKLVSVYPDDAPIGKIPYESSSWGDRKMELNFNAAGALVTVNFDFTSSAESFANAALEAGKGALNEYKTTVETVNSINVAKRQEELAVIQQKIDLINKSKEKVEADIALLGAEAGAESNLALQSMNVQLQQLTTQQQILMQQYAIDSSTILNPINQQTSVAEAQLALLQAQAGVDTYSTTSPWTLQQQQLNAQLSALQAQTNLNNFSTLQETASLQAQLETLKLQLQIAQLMKQIEELKNED